jgi:hypothetical protein
MSEEKKGGFGYDWSKVTKAELDNVDAKGNPRKAIQPGTYGAVISDIKVGKSKNGAFGAVITYTIDGGDEDGRQVKEGIYLTKRDGSPIPFGPNRLKTRMLVAGLTSEQINNFKFPDSEKSMGDFKYMLDAKVTLETDLREIKDGEAAGLKVSEVKKVYRRADEKAA